MNEWTMAHPHLTFTLVLFCILVMNNIISGLIKQPVTKNDEKKPDEKNNLS